MGWGSNLTEKLLKQGEVLNKNTYRYYEFWRHNMEKSDIWDGSSIRISMLHLDSYLDSTSF